MKRNKIAAGALALALGLGAVAPSFAADTKVSAEYTYDYKEAKNKFIEKWNALRAAEKALAKAEENEAAAKAAYEAALKALNDFEAVYGDNGSYITTLERYKKERYRHIDTYVKAGGQTPGTELVKIESEDVDTIGKHVTEVSTEDGIIDKTKAETQAEAVKDIVALNLRIKEFTKEDGWIQNQRANLQAELTRRQGDYNEAQNARQAAENAVEKLTNDAKTGEYDKAKKELIKEGVGVDVINRAEKAGDITLIFKDVKPAKPVEKDEIKPETRAALEKAILDAKIQIKAVETLKKTTPKTIAGVVDKLDKLVKEAEATIKMSEELLGKKAAFNVVSTAYAADEEKSAEEKAKELTEKLNEKTKEIEDTLKENEANQPAEEETKPETKPEEKPADDKKDEEKPAEDKKEDKKEEKTTTTTKVVKKAGNNAKTGIAGVAGVAGVLAAASVAYAASKKNN
ncbi:hypothetical protein [Anaerococcus sp. Marseille-Q7828]|uniref:hypothetical protein n=1 Tax=Anaerococcus sp. Marseille-Q7828 TaxID=3036300 RepID=UPI0024ACEB27|nr:hypothetical protein [Anaerococcus sp. Marseille-Q7828]